MSGVWFALGLTLLAGMATGIGSAIAFTARRTNYRFLSVAMGFSAGVMLYVSFVEIFFKGATALTKRYSDVAGYWVNTLTFFGGMAIIFVIDTLIPAGENPHEAHAEAETTPLHDPSAPLPRGSVAIALHNIPEGISVSVPIFYATGDHKKAFIYSLLSGFSEPVERGSPTSSSSSCSAAPAPTSPRSSWASCLPAWPASWCTSAWTSCSPPAGPTARDTTACTGWSRGCW